MGSGWLLNRDAQPRRRGFRFHGLGHACVVDDELLTLSAELAHVMRLVEDDDVAGTLHRFVTRATRAIPGCDQAAIVIRAKGGVEVIASSWEKHPSVPQPGPVIEALTFHEPRLLGDIATDQRWPAYSAELAAHGLRCCLALPLVTHSDQAAILVLYSATPNQFSDTTFDLVLLFALHAGVAFDNASLYHDSRKLIDQLRSALHTRALIGSAQGLLMHRNNYDTDRAFTALRTASQNNNIKLRELAALLVEAHERDELTPALNKYGLIP
jgi:GAF domain-containing protein